MDRRSGTTHVQIGEEKHSKSLTVILTVSQLGMISEIIYDWWTGKDLPAVK